MKSLQNVLIISALVFSASAWADRSRDESRGYHPKSHKQAKQPNQYRGDHRQQSPKGAHGSRQEAPKRQHQNQYQGDGRGYGNQHAHGQNHSGRHDQRHEHRGFNGDYRNNRHFDDRNYHYQDRGHNRRYGHDRGGYIAHNYYKPQKHYKKWKKRMKKYHKHVRNQHRHLYNYNVYYDDVYRYRPLRGLGHYFDRPGYGYGHWHEGFWCRDYHDEWFYRNYYSHYPYRDGWRHGDGDFGIWFSFNF